VGAGAALLIGFPVLAFLALAVKLSSPGPAFFRQERIGLGGRPFHCLKLRTMVRDAQERLDRDPELKDLHRRNGFKLPTRDDPRVTPLGRFLRRTHLDELPQLINAVRGDMSLVGPRPMERVQWEEWLEYDPDSVDVLSVPPGIFGAWTAQGRNRVEDPERILVELDYVRNRSLLLDLKILVRHLPVLLQGQGPREVNGAQSEKPPEGVSASLVGKP
jgi:exopolysaccharide production protein ExoY